MHIRNKRYICSQKSIAHFILTACEASSDTPIQQIDQKSRRSASEVNQISHQNIGNKKKERERRTFYFGFDLRSSPQEDATQYLPFLNYIEAVACIKSIRVVMGNLKHTVRSDL